MEMIMGAPKRSGEYWMREDDQTSWDLVQVDLRADGYVAIWYFGSARDWYVHDSGLSHITFVGPIEPPQE